MLQRRIFARRTRMPRFVFRYSVLLLALLFGASLLTAVRVGANDGELDFFFDGDGIVTTHLFELEQFNDIAIQPDGKIVAAGHTARFPFPGASQRTLSMAVARYTDDGVLDSTFGNGGIVTTDIGSHAMAMGVALQADGKIVVAGRGGTFLRPGFALVRYNTDGSIDFTFADGGLAMPSIGSFAHIVDLALQADGKIVVTGEATLRGESAPTARVARLTCIDGDLPGGDGEDRIRVRIWSDSTGRIYDNQLDAVDSVESTTRLGGGSIVFHQ